jgi:alpha-tubulin suppressor-like RCC1 family protein
MDRSAPVQVLTLGTSVSKVSAGGNVTCAKKSDGTLWCWGTGGQVGDGTTMNRSTPVQVLSSTVDVAVGGNHSCAIISGGTLWCWGANADGQLGDGTNTARTTPVQVTALGATVAQVSSGYAHTCARKLDGTLWCWGYNQYGQIGDETMTSSNVPVQVHVVGTSVKQVSLGTYFTCALRTDGTLWCFGYNGGMTIGVGLPDTWILTPSQLTTLGTDVLQVTTGDSHGCVRRSDFSVWCWGWNNVGQVGDGTTTDRSLPVAATAVTSIAKDIAAGAFHNCIIESDDTVWCWGYNFNGMLGNGTTSNYSLTPVQALLARITFAVPTGGGWAAGCLALLLIGAAIRRFAAEGPRGMRGRH